MTIELASDVAQSLSFEWQSAAAAVDQDEKAISIVIPVYGAIDETLACIYSVLTAKRDIPAHLIVIDDCSPDPQTYPALEQASDGGRLFTLWRNATNQGFVSTVNRGILAAPGDVVLLNSDTLVTDGWLDRLVAHARMDEAIASVSPMTNNATVLSYPKMNVVNGIPGDTNVADLAAMFATNRGRLEAVNIPVTVGFCMLLTAHAVAAVGAFDEALFGIGYGEECDWCMRASYLGFKHVVAIDAFVYHAGSVSFSERTAKRQALAERILAMRHPEYWHLIGQFCAGDPLLKVRRAVDVSRLVSAASRQKGIVVHVLHRLGGGTRVHVMKLAEMLGKEGYGSVFLLPDDVGRITVGTSFMDDLDNMSFNCADDLVLLQELFDGLSPLHCHIHALIGFSKEAERFIRSMAVPKIVTLHDYVAICPQITLLNETGSYCNIPSNVRCNACLRMKAPPLACRDIEPWRRDWHVLLSDAERVLAPSRFVEKTFHRLYPTLAIKVVPHDIGGAQMLPAVGERRFAAEEAGRPLEIAVFGNMNHHKGLDVVVGCAANARDMDLPLQFLLFGQAPGVADDFGGKLRMMGSYDQAVLPGMLGASACEIGFLPSIWPETFSYVLSEIMELGLHPVVFDLGAQADRLRDLGRGTILPLGMSATSLNAMLLGLLASRSDAANGSAGRPPSRYPADVPLDRTSYLESLYGADWTRRRATEADRPRADARR